MLRNKKKFCAKKKMINLLTKYKNKALSPKNEEKNHYNFDNVIDVPSSPTSPTNSKKPSTLSKWFKSKSSEHRISESYNTEKNPYSDHLDDINVSFRHVDSIKCNDVMTQKSDETTSKSTARTQQSHDSNITIPNCGEMNPSPTAVSEIDGLNRTYLYNSEINDLKDINQNEKKEDKNNSSRICEKINEDDDIIHLNELNLQIAEPFNGVINQNNLSTNKTDIPITITSNPLNQIKYSKQEIPTTEHFGIESFKVDNNKEYNSKKDIISSSIHSSDVISLKNVFPTVNDSGSQSEDNNDLNTRTDNNDKNSNTEFDPSLDYLYDDQWNDNASYSLRNSVSDFGNTSLSNQLFEDDFEGVGQKDRTYTIDTIGGGSSVDYYISDYDDSSMELMDSMHHIVHNSLTYDHNNENLPLGWTSKESRSRPGMVYYINSYTGDVQWERPTLAAPQHFSSVDEPSSSKNNENLEFFSPRIAPITTINETVTIFDSVPTNDKISSQNVEIIEINTYTESEYVADTSLEKFELYDLKWNVYSTEDGHLYYLCPAYDENGNETDQPHSQWHDPRINGYIDPAYYSSEEWNKYLESQSQIEIQSNEPITLLQNDNTIIISNEIKTIDNIFQTEQDINILEIKSPLQQSFESIDIIQQQQQQSSVDMSATDVNIDINLSSANVDNTNNTVTVTNGSQIEYIDSLVCTV